MGESTDASERPSSRIVNRDAVLDFIDQDCRGSGAICDVGPEYYQAFVDLGDEALDTVIGAIVLDRAEMINERCSQENGGEQVWERVLSILEMIAHGSMALSPSMQLVFVAPVGPPPDEVMAEQIQCKLDDASERIGPVILKILTAQRTESAEA